MDSPDVCLNPFIKAVIVTASTPPPTVSGILKYISLGSECLGMRFLFFMF